MTGETRFAADTSLLIAVLKGVIRSDRPFAEIGFPVPVVGELRFGAMGGHDSSRKLAEVEALLARGTVIPSDAATGRAHAELRHRLKTAGTPLPENDIWIAASCLQHDLTLLTLDRHFERIEGLALASS